MTDRFLTDGDLDVVLCGRVCLLRNLGGIPFPPLLDAGGRRRVLEEIRAAVPDRGDLRAGRFRFFAMDAVGETEAVSFVERGWADADFIAERAERGLFVSEDRSCSIPVNGEDHVSIRAVSAGSGLRQAFRLADWLDTVLDKSLHFAFDPRLGYLTCNPAHLGTGMVAVFLLHLPALAGSGAIARLSSNLLRIGMSLQNLREPDPDAGGAAYCLINRMTMGLSEQEAVENLIGIARQIVAQEREARAQYLAAPAAERAVKDAARSLRTAKALTYEEFLEKISLVRLGIAAKLLSGVGLDMADHLTRLVQPATLSLSGGAAAPPEAGGLLRAAAVREALSGLSESGAG